MSGPLQTPRYVGSGFWRLLSHVREIGPWRAAKLLYYHADTKAGELVGEDEYGNRYYENKNELPYRNRWVEYRMRDYDGAQIPADWQSWMHHIQQHPPPTNVMQKEGTQAWQTAHQPNVTFTRGAYRPYNSVSRSLEGKGHAEER